MAHSAARVVQTDLFECQQRTVSASFIQRLTASVAVIAEQKETQWHYELPTFKRSILSIAISLDGTCMHLSEEGWREAMTGTISFYDAQGERQHTLYLGSTPEHGKAGFFRRFTAEIEHVKALHPNVKYLGLADGADTNWQFLSRYTSVSILDFFHATGY